MERKPLVLGNWKMHKTISEAESYLDVLKQHLSRAPVQGDILLAVPFTALAFVAQAAKELPLIVGAQNMSDAREGALTGEISARMLVDAGAQFVILGHMERRQKFGESSAFINRKVLAALASGLRVVLCVGEVQSEWQAGKSEEVIEQQLVESLQGVTAEQTQDLVLAYEPAFAIMTGQTVEPDYADRMQACCRCVVSSHWGSDAGSSVRILYGGLANPDNASVLMSKLDIDGLLVGGSSLDPDTFAALITEALPIHSR